MPYVMSRGQRCVYSLVFPSLHMHTHNMMALGRQTSSYCMRVCAGWEVMGALAGGLSTTVINRNALAETVLTCGCFIGISVAHIYYKRVYGSPHMSYRGRTR